MGFNRPEAKLRARMAMRGAYPHPMLVTLVYVLMTTVLVGIVTYFVANPFMLYYYYLLDGIYDAQTIFRYVFIPSRVILWLALEILVSLYVGVMSFGYTSYALRLARGEQPGYRNLMDGFARAGRVLLTAVLIGVFTMLWSTAAMLPYLVVMVAAAVADQPALIALAMALLVAGMIFGISVVYRYRLAYYFLLDNPQMGSLEAITRSKLAMRGRKWELFVLDLSFLGWLLLTPFTLGILSLWLSPYMGASEANFYDHVVHGALSGQPDLPGPGGYTPPGGSYSPGPDDRSGPF